ETPGPLADVGKFPAGLGQYAGTKFGKKLTDVMRGLNPEFAPSDDDEKGNDLVDKRLKELLAAGPQGEVSASGASEVTLTIANYPEPEKAAKALVGCYSAMSAGGRLHSVVLKDDPKVTEGARKHGGFTFAEVRLSFDFEATVKDLPEGVRESTLAQIKRMVSEKMRVWIGTDGKTVVQGMAPTWKHAVSTLDK